MELCCSNLKFSFNRAPLFKNLSFVARPGAHTVLKGDSGSGKSTFLKLLLGFYRPDEGRISIGGEEYSPQNIRKYTAWLPQDLNMGSGLVMEVIQKPFEFDINSSASVSKTQIVDILDKLGLSSHILDQPFQDLSTGQRQRIGIAMCHLLDKPLILLDEPTSALDETSKEQVVNLLLGHTSRTIVSVSHDPWWINYADNLIKLN